MIRDNGRDQVALETSNGHEPSEKVEVEPWETVEVEPWEIGGALLDILSRGLYSDARDAVREYVQNGIDAGASTIFVTVDGPSLTVRDDGAGMNKAGLRSARRFGVSDKSPRHNVGYRGIGLYSAFGMCEKLSILTRVAGQSKQFRLEMRFGEMRRILEEDRRAERRGDISLAPLIMKHTSFLEEGYTGPEEDQFTMVSLEGLIQEYRAQLHEADFLNKYLLSSIPVALPDMAYGSKVNRWMRDYAGLNPVRLVLRVGEEYEREVRPQVVPDAVSSRRRWVVNEEKKRIAFMWHALTSKGERIPASSNASGFLLKVRGFTLGDRDLLKRLWPSTGGRALYQHFSGEVHVLDEAGVYPNAARDDLEPGARKDDLHKALRKSFANLNIYADDNRVVVRAERELRSLRAVLDDLEERVTTDEDENPYELFSRAEKVEEELNKHELNLYRVVNRDKSPLVAKMMRSAEGLLRETGELRLASRRISRRASRRSEEDKREEEDRGKPKGTSSERSGESRKGGRSPAKTRLKILVDVAASISGSFGDPPTDSRVAQAKQGVDAAIVTGATSGASEALDNMKAEGVDLPEVLESFRVRLRELNGLAPNFPVSLEEALSEEGFTPETSSEARLLRCVDAGLLDSLGGRGEAYDDALGAIVMQFSLSGEEGSLDQ